MKTKKTHLEVVEKKLVVTIQNPINPQEFFQTKKRLYVWSDFKERILAKVRPTDAGKKFTVASFKLIKDSTDEQIEADLPQEHLFSETDVCAIVAEMITKQSKGEAGDLLSNGYANLFYTDSFVVYVLWSSFGRRWSVDAWSRGGYEWDVDDRVFSPAN